MNTAAAITGGGSRAALAGWFFGGSRLPFDMGLIKPANQTKAERTRPTQHETATDHIPRRPKGLLRRR